jgi:rubrerythrin
MTNNTFTESEMFKVAMLMEDEGYNFYINGANHTTGKTKEFLLVAAGQEFIHKEKFTKLFKKN